MSAEDATAFYRHVGRGGAGNYKNEQELVAAQKRLSEVCLPAVHFSHRSR